MGLNTGLSLKPKDLMAMLDCPLTGNTTRWAAGEKVSKEDGGKNQYSISVCLPCDMLAWV